MANNVMRVPVRGSGSSMPEYGARTQTAVAGAGASARLDDSAAGIALSGNWKERNWKDLYNLGQAVESAAIAGHQLYMDYQQTKAREAWNEYQREAMQEKARLNDLKGRDAVGEQGVQAQLNKWQTATRQRLLKDLGEPAQILFGKMADDEDARLNAWGISKSAGEFRAWQDTVDEGQILTAQQQAMADPAKLAESMGVIQARYYDMGRRNGWDTGYTRARFEQVQQKTVADMVTTAIDGEQLSQARTLLGQYGALLGPARKGLEARLQAQSRALQARAETAQRKAEEQQMLTGAQQVLADTRGLPPAQRESAIMESLSAIEDTALRDRMWAQAKKELAFEKARTEAADGAAAYELVTEGRKAGESPIQFQMRVNNAEASEAAKKLAQEQFNGKLEENELNMRALTELRGRIDAAERAERPLTADDVYAFAFNRRMTTGQINAALKYLNGGGNLGALKQSAVNSAWKELNPGSTDKDVPDWLFEAVQKLLPPGKDVNPAELRRHAARAMMQGTVEGRVWGNAWRTSMRYGEALAEGRADSFEKDEDAE